MSQGCVRTVLASWRLGVRSLCVLAALSATAATQSFEFDVASIKLHGPDNPGSSIATMSDGTFVAVNIPIRNLLGTAYPSQNGEYTGLPGWALSDRYDVTVKPPAGATREQTQQMWRTLFTERMKLVAHDEMREEPIYNLIAARADGRLGPQLARSTHDCAAESAAARQRTGPPPPLTSDADFLDSCGYRVGGGRLVGGGMTMAQIAQQLRGASGRIVRDMTGLTGWYRITFTYGTGQPPAAGVAPDPNEPASVFTAVQEQLGLKLESDRMRVQTVVIDHIERPTAN